MQVGIFTFSRTFNRLFDIFSYLFLLVFELFEEINPSADGLTGKVILGLRPAFAEETLPGFLNFWERNTQKFMPRAKNAEKLHKKKTSY